MVYIHEDKMFMFCHQTFKNGYQWHNSSAFFKKTSFSFFSAPRFIVNALLFELREIFQQISEGNKNDKTVHRVLQNLETWSTSIKEGGQRLSREPCAIPLWHRQRWENVGVIWERASQPKFMKWFYLLSESKLTTTRQGVRSSITPAPGHRRMEAGAGAGPQTGFCADNRQVLLTPSQLPPSPRADLGLRCPSSGILTQTSLSDNIVVRTVCVNMWIKHLFCTVCLIHLKLNLWGRSLDKVRRAVQTISISTYFLGVCLILIKAKCRGNLACSHLLNSCSLKLERGFCHEEPENTMEKVKRDQTGLIWPPFSPDSQGLRAVALVSIFQRNSTSRMYT